MLTIRNKQNEKLMTTVDVMSAPINESINREYTLNFSILYDYEKTQYVQPPNIAEVNNDWFDIVFIKEQHLEDGSKVIHAECEHVSYQLNDEEYDLPYLIAAGTKRELLSVILDGTPFTADIVEDNTPVSLMIEEELSRRAILIMFAEQMEMELVFHRFEISLVNKRGKDEGQQLRIGKNVRAITRQVDARQKDEEGNPTIAYEVDLIQLGFNHGYADLEVIGIGDTVRVIDEDLNLSTTQRIVSYEYDAIHKINSSVEIANFIPDLSDTLTGIQKDTVYKDRVYNGVRVGPYVGFEAVRSDKLARTIMNATEGLRIQKGDGNDSYVDVIFLDTDGNARFTGRIDASEIYGGIINGAEIIANTTIDVGTDLRVGNMIYVGSGGNFNKGIIFSDLASIRYSDGAMQMGASAVTISATGSAEGKLTLTAGREVDIYSEGEMTTVDGISFRLSGNELLVYNNRTLVGNIPLGDGSVG